MPSTRKSWKSRTTRRPSYHTKSYWFGGASPRPYRPTASYSPSMFYNHKKHLQAKIGSYRTLNQQFTGAGKVTAFSPTAANKWIKYVDQGAWVYKFNNTQFCKFFGPQFAHASPTAAYRFLRQKYGAGIKAVTRGKGNTWLVAAMPSVTARPFYNYTWK